MKSINRILAVLIVAFLCSSQIAFGHSGMLQSGNPKPVLTVGDDINYPPYSYMDSSGNPAGFNVDLAKAVGKSMGYDVKIKLGAWSEIRTELETGKIDMISGLAQSKDRDKLYEFTSKHSVVTGAIFTKQNIALQSLQDLEGKTVVVQEGEITGEFLAKQGLNIHLVQVANISDALSLVSNGTYQYAGMMKLPGLYVIQQEKFQNLKAQDMTFNPIDYCLAVKKGNSDLLMILNGGLQLTKATGDYQKIYEKNLSVYEKRDLISLLRPYAWIAIAVLGFVAALFLWGFMLRKLVSRKTRELLDANKTLQEQQEELTASHEEMEASLEELIAIEEELREQYERLTYSENQLKISEERNSAIMNALPDILFVLNREGRFIDCQARNESELLLPKEMFIGKVMDEVLPEHIAKTGFDKIQTALKTGELQTFEYELTLDGQPTIFELRIARSQADEVIGITRNITDQRAYQQRIEYLSYHDQLTGLFNRRFFEEELERLDILRNLPLCIIMADVNGLKLINDSFGHRVGDELLLKVAQVLKRACRADEIISRIGGDEFVILLPNMENNQAEDLIRRIKSISDLEMVASVNLSISFGWEAKRTLDEDIHEIFNRAEDYMYKKKLFEGPSMRGKTIGAIINTLHEKNKREEQHSQRVSCLSKQLASEMNLSERDIEEIISVGLLHDIGKIGISEDILNKPGRLTEDEFEEVRRHPEIGYRILSSVNDMAEMAEYVLSHHERWDGKGYPRGIVGEAIPLQSRMIAIVDAFDAMTSERSYRNPMTEADAVAELIRNAGTQFDPTLVQCFVDTVLQTSVVSEYGA